MEKGDKYKKLYQHKLMKLTQSEEQVLKSIEGLSVGMKKFKLTADDFLVVLSEDDL